MSNNVPEAVTRAQQVARVLSELTGEIDAARQLVPPALKAMHAARLFRLSLPRSVGGEELSPGELAAVTMTIAQGDASAAWCLGQAFGCAMSAAFMSGEAAQEVFGPANAVLAWGAGVQGEATRCEGGFRVKGTWRFASGGKHATWIGAHCKVLSADGTPERNPDGKAVNRTMLLPREAVEIHDDWWVMGLRGTRSEGYTIDDAFVPERLSLDRETPAECQVNSPLYLVPTTHVYAGVFAGVALGIARRTIDDLIDLSQAKKPRGVRNTLCDSPVFQTDLAELEARWRAARTLHRVTLDEVFDEVKAAMEMSLDQRMRIRLATTHAIREATELVQKVFVMAGSDAIFQNKPFEQRFRDIHTVSQQVQGRRTNMQTVGQHLLGQDIASIFV